MDEQEKNISEVSLPAEETEASAAEPEAPAAKPKYIDRSDEADRQEEYVEPGAVWEGPAFKPEDADEERRRVQQIIAQNVHAQTPQQPQEEEQAETPEKKHIPRSRLIIGIALAALLIAAVVFTVLYFTGKNKPAEPEPQSDAQSEETEQAVPYFASQEDMSEEDAKKDNFPREIAIPTPMEFFTAGKTFAEYTYNYFYIYGAVLGYDTIEGLRCIVVQTAIGNIVLLDSMFTIPVFKQGEIYYFYYLYAGFDTSLGMVFGEYVDYSVENEGIPEIRSYADGTYVVGKDLDAGEYFFSPTAAEGAHIDLYADNRYIQKLVSEDVLGGYFLTLEDGQILVVTGMRFAVSTAISMSAPANLHDFMYRVGKDIEAGVYRVTSDGSEGAYYALYDTASPIDRAAVSEGTVEGEIYITAEEGQYLYLVHSFAVAVDPDEVPQDGGDVQAEDSVKTEAEEESKE